jgi:TRAP-type uncharacterized transport system substrate-binding protein
MSLLKDPALMASPVKTRSLIVLEIAAEMVLTNPDRLYAQTKVLLRRQGTEDWPVCLYASNTVEGIDAVVKGETHLGLLNPVIPLTLAYRGTGPFKTPQPVRTISVIPSLDQYVFAVKSDTGLTSFEEIGNKRCPLRLSLRGERKHCLHMMLDDIMAAAGFSIEDIKSWGGTALYEGPLPFPGGVRFQSVERGDANAIFDEASDAWVDAALQAGMTILPLSEALVRKLEAIGYRRGVLSKDVFPRLPADVLTIDFSGWPIFVHRDAPDDLVAQICAALDARKDRIPWQGQGPLPIERMCRDAPDTPLDVPLHRAAEQYWRQRGYLS